MKLGGNLPPGHDALLFSISGVGSFICPVAETRMGTPRPLITMDHWVDGKPKCSGTRRRPKGMGCGVWGVGCGVWGVGCGVWGGAWRHAV